MRIGVLAKADQEDFDWIASLGLTSMGWMAFAQSACALENSDWKIEAKRVAEQAESRGIRISAIGAYYANPLDPKQTDRARNIFERAISVAEHIGVGTVSGFPGAVVELEINSRGGNPIYKPLEDFLPQIVSFWEPIAQFAADKGVRIAFEHCPQGHYHLPIMHYNVLGQPAVWERFFDLTRSENLGLEWDPSHLICQLIDPVQNVHTFGSRIFHVHAKDAYIDPHLLARYGICHPGVAEHRVPGFGQANWPQIIHALLRAGYDSDLNIEGRHDPVLRDVAYDRLGKSEPRASSLPGARNLESAGLLMAKSLLERYTLGNSS